MKKTSTLLLASMLFLSGAAGAQAQSANYYRRIQQVNDLEYNNSWSYHESYDDYGYGGQDYYRQDYYYPEPSYTYEPSYAPSRQYVPSYEPVYQPAPQRVSQARYCESVGWISSYQSCPRQNRAKIRYAAAAAPSVEHTTIESSGKNNIFNYFFQYFR